MVKKTKKRKKRFGGGGFASASKSREQSPLRPKYVEKTPPCRNICPSGNRIREFITTIAQAERLNKPTEQAFQEAWEIYTDTSPFPAVCGRVCPHPCEDNCNRKEVNGAVNINVIERAIGDFGLEKGLTLKSLSDEKRPEKIAVVGAGPAGLSCAYQLARRGYAVTVFEAADKPGGMLLWSIPRHRLPADVLAGEIQKILDLGVELKCHTRVGKDVSLEYLRSEHQAVFANIGGQEDLKLRGDAISLAPVTTAVAHGRRAAESIDRNLRGEEPPAVDEMPVVLHERMRLDHYEKQGRGKPPVAPVEERPATMDAEVDLPMAQEKVIEEAKRCMSCGYCFDCKKCWLFCQDQAIDKPMEKGVVYKFRLQNCTGCKKCAEECPCGFIDML